MSLPHICLVQGLQATSNHHLQRTMHSCAEWLDNSRPVEKQKDTFHDPLTVRQHHSGARQPKDLPFKFGSCDGKAHLDLSSDTDIHVSFWAAFFRLIILDGSPADMQ